MGVYDILDVPGCEGAQVKCFSLTLKTLKVGDRVGRMEADGGSYAVALREGGYLIVTEGVIHHWQQNPPEDVPIYDKYGAQFDKETWRGTLGEDYLFKEELMPKTGGSR